MLELYPDEKELHERVQLYLRVCERNLAPVDGTPRTPEEQVYAATLAVNAGAYDRATDLATGALTGNPNLDGAEYILAVALTLRGDIPGAIVHLRRAMDLNPENRDLARRDADLDALRRSEDGRSLLASQLTGGRHERKSSAARSKGNSR